MPVSQLLTRNKTGRVSKTYWIAATEPGMSASVMREMWTGIIMLCKDGHGDPNRG